MWRVRERLGEAGADRSHAHRVTTVATETEASEAAVPSGAVISGPAKRAWRAVSVCLLLASLIVLLTVGYHASLLGDVPINWNPDRAREDIWVAARSRYLQVTVVIALAILVAWAGLLLSWPDPQHVRVLGRSEARRRMTLLTVLSIGLASALVVAPYSVSISRPLLVGVVAVILTVAVGLAGLFLRGTAEAGSDLAVAATGVLVPAFTLAPAWGAFTTAWAFFPENLSLVFVPLGFYAVWLAVGVPLSVRTLKRWWIMLRTPADAAGDTPAGMTRRERSEEPELSTAQRALTVLIVLLIGAGTVWAAQPVRAPSAQTVPPLLDRSVTLPAIAAEPWPGNPGDVNAIGSSEPAPVPDEIVTCRPYQLDIVALGDSTEYAVLVATNVSEAPCGLTGHVSLRLMQGEEPIALRPVGDDDLLASATGLGAVLEPGGHAHAELSWPGYGRAADFDTPQQLYVTVDPSTRTEAEVRLQIAHDGEERGLDGTVTPVPAPFDLKAGVKGGAEIRTGVWTPGP